jgi:hypothetical protein
MNTLRLSPVFVRAWGLPRSCVLATPPAAAGSREPAVTDNCLRPRLAGRPSVRAGAANRRMMAQSPTRELCQSVGSSTGISPIDPEIPPVDPESGRSMATVREPVGFVMATVVARDAGVLARHLLEH